MNRNPRPTSLHLPAAFFLFLLLLGSSCSPLYVPNAVNAPMLTDEKQLNLALSTGTSTLDFMASGSPMKHLGLLANFSFAPEEANAVNRHIFGEGGAGYYFATEDLILDVYGGVGLGSTISGGDQGQYLRFFVQPGITAHAEMADFAFTPRISFVSMNQLGVGTYPLVPFFEPSFTVRLGYRNVKCFSQFGLSIPYAAPDYNVNWVMWNFGVNFNIGTIWE